MPVDCGSQAGICSFPIRLDTYKGCSHGCAYCFARSGYDISNIRATRSAKSLRKFVTGERTSVTRWCNWNIPLHWGGMSDPFHPLEAKEHASLECLEIFAETGYPFIVSTKGKLVADEPYISILEKCRCIVQVSMVCPSYDRMEPGAPPFVERLGMVRVLASRGVRVVVRVQPFIVEVADELLEQIPKISGAGAYAVTVEGMKFKRVKPGLVRVGGDYCYKTETLRRHYVQIRKACHEAGLMFLCAENRLRSMGDSMQCCCGDVPGFEGNAFNAVSLMSGEDVKPRGVMSEVGTAGCFKAVYQDTSGVEMLKRESFEDEVRKLAGKGLEAKATDRKLCVRVALWLRGRGFTSGEIDGLTGTKMGTHYLCTREEGQVSIPTVEAWQKISKSPKASNPPRWLLKAIYGK